ncbi:MAG: hypothetical protein R2745_05780 [Vicinamibacterales bacterium]
MTRWPGAERGWLLALLAGATVLRLALAANPGYYDDLRSYAIWGDVGARHGIASIYDAEAYPDELLGNICDYPPGLPYGLMVASAVNGWVRGGEGLADRPYQMLQVKLLPLLGDLVLTILVFAAARALAGSRMALLAAASYALNPAALFDSGYWGQTDSIVFAWIGLGLAGAWTGRAVPAGLAMGLAMLTKPVAWPFAALAVVLGWRRHGPRPVVAATVTALAVGVAAFLPFAAAGRLADTLASMLTQLGSMPNVSNNAHNLWAVFALWANLEADYTVAGPLDLRLIGILLFLGVYLRYLVRLWQDPTLPTVLLSGAMTALALFVLSVHQHENHLFGVLPFLAALCVVDRRIGVLYAAFSTTLLANMALHDPYLLSLVLSAPEGWRAIEFYGVPVTSHADATPAFQAWVWIVGGNILANLVLFVRALQVAERFRHEPRAPGRPWLDLTPPQVRAVMMACIVGALLSAWWVTAAVNPSTRGYWAAQAQKAS